MRTVLAITCLLLSSIVQAQSTDIYNLVNAMGLKGKIKSIVSYKYTGQPAPDFKHPEEKDKYHRATYMFAPDGRMTFAVSSDISGGRVTDEYTMMEYRTDGTAEGNIYSSDTVLIRKQEFKPLSDTSYELSEYNATNGVMIYRHRFILNREGKLLTEEAIHYKAQTPMARITEMVYDKAGNLVRKNTLAKKADNSPGTGSLDIIYHIEARDKEGNPAKLTETHTNGQKPFNVINVYTYYE